MKTKNNVQKTILKTLAVVTSLVLIGITANAQPILTTVVENNSYNEIAMVHIVKSESGTTGDVTMAALSNETEIPLELENWMTNAEFFELEMMKFEAELELPLELENWVIDGAIFGKSAIETEIEAENVLELENWVIDENFGIGNTGEVLKQNSLEQEIALELEPWLFANNNWK